MVEAVAAAIFGLLVAFLLMFLVDRVWDTPASIRLLLFVAAWVGAAIVPLAFYRWVWRNRRLEQLARLLGRRHPQVGDQLLGIIELVRSDSEQARSRALCEAAIRQVAEDAQPARLPGRRAQPSAPALGLAGRRRGRVFPWPACCLSRRGHERLAAAARSLERHAALHVRGRRAVARHAGGRARRAVRSRGAARREDGLAAARGRGPARRAASRHGPAPGRAVRVRAAVADRSRLARRPHRRLGRSASGSSRPCVPS